MKSINTSQIKHYQWWVSHPALFTLTAVLDSHNDHTFTIKLPDHIFSYASEVKEIADNFAREFFNDNSFVNDNDFKKAFCRYFEHMHRCGSNKMGNGNRISYYHKLHPVHGESVSFLRGNGSEITVIPYTKGIIDAYEKFVNNYSSQLRPYPSSLELKKGIDIILNP